MRLLLKEVDERLITSIDKTITADNVYGIIKFGEKNDYPQIMERIILSSIDARSVASIYAKFLVGAGFENEVLNNIVIGKDMRGKDIKLISLLRQYAFNASFFAGGYVHVNINGLGEVVTAKSVPFKNGRYVTPDGRGYSSKIAVYDNWEKDKSKRYDKANITYYDVFNLNPNVLAAQFSKTGSVEQHKGQIYALFLDESYFYPLSPFDPVYLDCDTQSQISVYKNNQIRNGFSNKAIFRVAGDESAVEELAENIRNMMGADGDNCSIIEDQVNPETGKLDKEGGQVIQETLTSNVNPRLFSDIEDSLTNAIRKANKALPRNLIEYETGSLGSISAESIEQSVAFYNAMTADDRASVSEMFKEIFSHSVNPILKNNDNWNIKPVNLNEYFNTKPTAAAVNKAY